MSFSRKENGEESGNISFVFQDKKTWFHVRVRELICFNIKFKAFIISKELIGLK